MNRIVFLWCHPRSMSTALERIMRERGDCTCFHEPFMYDYYVARAVRQMPHFDVEAGRPARYAEIREMILQAGDASHVFVKDMAYYMVPQIFDDPNFARRLSHCFLVRDPLKSIPSYYRLDAGLTCEEIGHEAQWHLHDWLTRELGLEAPIIEAEAVQSDPQGLITRLWQVLGLAPCPQAFEWDASATPADWQQVSGWHAHAQSSSGICKPAEETDEARQDAFARVAAKAPRLRDYLDHHASFYERLKAQALK